MNLINKQNPKYWFVITLAAAAVLMITMGARQSLGLFVSPINTTTGVGIAGISFAMAIGQFTWGAVQPIAGAVADRYGPAKVLSIGILVLALGSALTPFVTTQFGLAVTIGFLLAAGSGISSFSVLLGATATRLSTSQRGTAAGIINAGGSFGQFVFAPLLQKLISLLGWIGAMWSLAIITLAALPLIRILCPKQPDNDPKSIKQQNSNLRATVVSAMTDRSYLLLHGGFFTCGFHIAFLVTHLPGEVNLCGLSPSVASWSLAIIGLANIVGSLITGWWVNRYRSKYILFWMYASRTVLILFYLIAPKTEITFYLFAAGLGFTWLATVPPTAGLVGKLFGPRYLATLFGLTLLSHQIGGFLGAWLGGIAISQYGNYTWMWYADALLAAAAAAINLPIRESKIEPQLAST